MITIYTLPRCVHCNRVKIFLNYYRLPYVEYDVSRDQVKLQDMYYKSGQYGTPVIDLDGHIIVGFNEPYLIQILRQRGYLSAHARVARYTKKPQRTQASYR